MSFINLFIGYNKQECFRILICAMDEAEALRLAEEYRIDAGLCGEFTVSGVGDISLLRFVDCDYVISSGDKVNNALSGFIGSGTTDDAFYKKLSNYKEFVSGYEDGSLLPVSDVLNMLNQLEKDYRGMIEAIRRMGNIQFSSFSKPLIAVEDIINILEG